MSCGSWHNGLKIKVFTDPAVIRSVNIPLSSCPLQTFDPHSLLLLGAALVLLSSLHAALLWLGHRREADLGHVLAATSLQGLGLLGYLALPWLGPLAAVCDLWLLLAGAYGLWALRRYAGLPVRVIRWVWLALGSWLLVVLAFQAMGFHWVLGLVTPLLLAVLALGSSRELGGLAWEGGFKLPAQVCAGLMVALALAALGVGGMGACLSASGSSCDGSTRAWWFFGILGAQQLVSLLLAQVQGQRVRGRLVGLVATDPLTGLASALGFRERLDRAVGRSLRTGKTTSILVLELDNFEALVVAHGQAPMGRILEAFGQTLNTTLREADFPGRLEGCRFIALLHQTPPMEALLAAERLRAVWEDLPLTLGAHVFRATLSGGVASTREPIDGPDQLLALAMARAASARLGGGNNVEGEPA